MKPIYLILIVCVLGCAKSPKEFEDFEKNSSDSILKLEAIPSTIKANGYDTLLVKIKIDSKTSEDKRQINLSTTLGKFIKFNAQTGIDKPNANGEYETPLIAPTVPGTGYISAEVGGRKKTIPIVFGEAEVSSVLSLTAPNSIDADGVSTANIRLSVPKALALAGQTVTLTTTAGTFVETSSNSIIVKPLADGTKQVLLRAPVGPVFASITAELGAYRQTKEVEFKAVDSNKLLKIDVQNASTEADGFSTVEIKIKSIANADGSKRSATLVTTAGTFVRTGTNTIIEPLGPSDEATIALRAPNVSGIVYLSADVSPFRQNATVQFTTAYPERVRVDPGRFDLRAGLNQQITVTVYLERDKGKPSPNATVYFDAFDEDNNRIGQFRSQTLSDANGTATAIYTVGNTSYRRKVTIKAWIKLADGTDKLGQSEITIIDP